MNESQRIADLHRRAFDGDAWHGPHVFDVLDGVDAGLAAKKPIPTAHSIWEIVLHMRVWEEVVLRRLRGETYNPTPEEDWPPVAETGRHSWIAALAALRRTHEELQREIEKTPEGRLELPAPNSKRPMYQLLHGAVQHALYHAGQIAVLRKG
jgi:uncharacterized damage-inducible protein DinB